MGETVEGPVEWAVMWRNFAGASGEGCFQAVVRFLGSGIVPDPEVRQHLQWKGICRQ